jgi:hypothetical protein
VKRTAGKRQIFFTQKPPPILGLKKTAQAHRKTEPYNKNLPPQPKETNTKSPLLKKLTCDIFTKKKEKLQNKEDITKRAKKTKKPPTPRTSLKVPHFTMNGTLKGNPMTQKVTGSEPPALIRPPLLKLIQKKEVYKKSNKKL